MAKAGRKAAGLDVGAAAVSAVVVDPQTGEVLRARTAERAGEDLPRTLARLRDALGLKGMRLAVTAEADLVVTRTRLPFTDRRRLHEVAAYHVEDSLPFDISDWVTDHLVLSEVQEGAELMVFAQRRSEVAGLMDDLLEAGLYPDRLLPRPFALVKAAGRQVEEGRPFACLWVGRGRLSIGIARGASLLVARSVPLGVAGAEALGPEGVVDLALREVRASLWTAGVPLHGCLVLVGAEEGTDGELSRRLADALGPAAMELRSERGDGEGAGMEYVPAAGAARALADGVALDLAHDVRSVGHLLRAVARPLTAFLLTTLLAGVALLGHEGRSVARAADALEHNQRVLEQTWRALYPDEALPPDPMLRVESDLRATASGALTAEGPQPVEALGRLDPVMDALPPDKVDVRGFRVEAGQVTLHCSADNLGAADEVVAALQQEVEADVTARNPMSPGQGTYTFDINVQWRERDAGEAE